jgi:hypothetical protein
MFRALTCPSSGGKIVSTQHLVSSLSVNICTVHTLRADSKMKLYKNNAAIWYNKTCRARQITPTYANKKESALNLCTVQTFTESEDTRCCVDTIFPPEDGYVNA